MKIRVDEVVVPPRLRSSMGNLDALAQSIADIGLLHPIVIDSGRRLLAGYRRLEAHKLLGLVHIEATVMSVNDAKPD